jgi:hypothetical protein
MMDRTMPNLRLVLSLTAVAVVAAGSARAAGIDPHDFDVKMTDAPSIDPGTSPDFTASGIRMAGTVAERGGGRNGKIEASCDYELHVRVSGQQTTASGTQRCSWFMSFSDGTLAGTLEGSNRTTMSPDGGSMTGSQDVSVVAGTGVFAGKVGSGTFSQSQQLAAPQGKRPSNPNPPSTPPGQPKPPPGVPAPGVCVVKEAPPPGTPLPPGCDSIIVQPFALRSLSSVGAKAKGNRLKLKLRDGAAGARIASPGKKLGKKKGDGGLRVVTVPGASCTATAAKGSETVELGSGTDANKDGLVIVTKKLRPKLGAGVWKLRADCSFSGGNATASSTVHIA